MRASSVQEDTAATSASRSRTDVVIVGGGPAGLAAALAARNCGFDVTVLEAGHPPIEKACGEGLLPEAIRTLSNLGVEVSSEDGFPFEGIRFISGSRRVEAKFIGEPGIAVRRPRLHARLVESAERAGVKLLWNSPVRALAPNGVWIGGHLMRAPCIIGADGLNSSVRRWAGLDQMSSGSRRIGLRRHYRMRPWSSFVDVHWARNCQCYVTPVGSDEVGIAFITRESSRRFNELLSEFPDLAERLEGAEPASTLRGAPTVLRRLARVRRGGIALVGDASGSVDAITGSGLSLAFRQAAALGDSLARGDLGLYSRAHARIACHSNIAASILLAMDRHEWLRERIISVLAAKPGCFQKMVNLHAGGASALANRSGRPSDTWIPVFEKP